MLDTKKLSPAIIILINIALMAPHAASMQKPTAARWRGRAIPMAYNSAAKQWSLLLSHKVGDPNDLFTDFAQVSNPGDRANTVAAAALKGQTNAVYDETISGVPYVQTQAGDWFHFVPIKFINGRDLYDKARNAVKDDFMWVPAEDVIDNKEIKHPRRGVIKLSNAVKDVLNNHLKGIIAQLNQRGVFPSYGSSSAPSQTSAVQSPSQPAVAQKMPAAGQTWLTIPGALLFYENGKPHYEFTNFYPFAVNIDNKIWPTNEHYFQAQKFTDPNIQDKIRNLATARAAFDEGKNRNNPLRPDWDSKKIEVMEKAVRAKFSQPALKNLLISTGTRTIVENAGANDAYWGAGADGKGQNMLGRILMHIRDELTGKISPGTPFKP